MRGYQKRVVCLKNTGSDLFEEAYFIVKSGRVETDFEKRRKMLIEEAGRIIEESLCDGERVKRCRIPTSALIYAAGFLTAVLFTAIIILVF